MHNSKSISAGKLSALEEFRVQKDEYLKKIEELEEQLIQKDEILEDEIYQLEKKAVADKDRYELLNIRDYICITRERKIYISQ